MAIGIAISAAVHIRIEPGKARQGAAKSAGRNAIAVIATGIEASAVTAARDEVRATASATAVAIAIETVRAVLDWKLPVTGTGIGLRRQLPPRSLPMQSKASEWKWHHRWSKAHGPSARINLAADVAAGAAGDGAEAVAAGAAVVEPIEVTQVTPRSPVNRHATCLQPEVLIRIFLAHRERHRTKTARNHRLRRFPRHSSLNGRSHISSRPRERETIALPARTWCGLPVPRWMPLRAAIEVRTNSRCGSCHARRARRFGRMRLAT